eukprot:TRINITY_DN7320_c0_g1_i3.p1 TRINITY_DN7320_c0_g1~~TRINITY_DN7320_c0_g1_i3.p1  ORF type:complete len:357 (-),score=43.55 TRINITY_DN7320_c0_g1_i3:807-1877(-)
MAAVAAAGSVGSGSSGGSYPSLLAPRPMKLPQRLESSTATPSTTRSSSNGVTKREQQTSSSRLASPKGQQPPTSSCLARGRSDPRLMWPAPPRLGHRTQRSESPRPMQHGPAAGPLPVEVLDCAAARPRSGSVDLRQKDSPRGQPESKPFSEIQARSTLLWVQRMLRPGAKLPEGAEDRNMATMKKPEGCVDDRLKYQEIVFHEAIGVGSFGAVWSGQWHGRRVAVKQSKKLEDGDTAMLCQEMQYLQRLRHPSLVSFFGCCEHESHGLVIVMEYMNGGSLFDLLCDALPLFRCALDLYCFVCGLTAKHKNMMTKYNRRRARVRAVAIALLQVCSAFCGRTLRASYEARSSPATIA